MSGNLPVVVLWNFAFAHYLHMTDKDSLLKLNQTKMSIIEIIFSPTSISIEILVI